MNKNHAWFYDVYRYYVFRNRSCMNIDEVWVVQFHTSKITLKNVFDDSIIIKKWIKFGCMITVESILKQFFEDRKCLKLC